VTAWVTSTLLPESLMLEAGESTMTLLAGPGAGFPCASMIGVVLVNGSLAAWLPRVAHRLAVALDDPPRASCGSCRRAFTAGPRGWLRAGSACPDCPTQWWIVSVAVALASAAMCWRTAGPAVDEIVMLVGWLLIIQLGALLSLIDLAVMRLPSDLVVGLAAVVGSCAAITAWLAVRPHGLGLSMVGALIAGGFYLLLALVLPSQIGLGDVRLAAVLGAALGIGGWSPIVLGVILPYVVVFPFAVAYLLRGASRKAQLPFGPFLVAGAVLARVLTD
jgi:leader peptidase (prepilin peptidase)/N-methyltransferase